MCCSECCHCDMPTNEAEELSAVPEETTEPEPILTLT
jgi:hypothetical protein